MGTACVLFRESLTYRRDAFQAGLQRLGYDLVTFPQAKPSPGDVLVLWNRKPDHERYARAYEAVGADVLIAENGYIGKAPDGGKLYALARGHHNGAGTWPTDGPAVGQRWDALGIDLKPWRETGSHILVLPQRGIGEPGVAMPRDWLARTLAELGRRTNRPIRIRRHPGREKVEPDADFVGAWACVTWGSGAAIKALAAGVPVFYGLDRWIGRDAAFPLQHAFALEEPVIGDLCRERMFRRLAWAQWNLAEIESGEAFACLLR